MFVVRESLEILRTNVTCHIMHVKDDFLNYDLLMSVCNFCARNTEKISGPLIHFQIMCIKIILLTVVLVLWVCVCWARNLGISTCQLNIFR